MTHDSHRKKLQFLNRVVWASFIGIFAFLILGPMLFLIFSDFPCLATVDPLQRCLSIRYPGFHYADDPSRGEITATLEVFLNHRSAYAMGGGCFHAFSSGSAILLRTSRGQVRLESAGDTVLVDGHPLAPGESMKRVGYWHWNPWMVSLLQVQNAGPVSDCPSTESSTEEVPLQRISGERVVVLGDFGTIQSLRKGLIILMALASIGTFLSRRIRMAD